MLDSWIKNFGKNSSRETLLKAQKSLQNEQMCLSCPLHGRRPAAVDIRSHQVSVYTSAR